MDSERVSTIAISSTGNTGDVKIQGGPSKTSDQLIGSEDNLSDKGSPTPADVGKLQAQKSQSKQCHVMEPEEDMTEKTVNFNEEPEEDKIPRARVGVVGSAPQIARFAWEALPKISAAVGLANDYKNGGVTRDIINAGNEAIKKNIDTMKKFVEKSKNN